MAEPAWQTRGVYDAEMPLSPPVGGADGHGRSLRRSLASAGVAAAVIAVAGAPVGVLWHVVAPTVPVINTGQVIVVSDPSPEEYIAADGWFTLMFLAFGVATAVTSWMLLRRHRGPLLLAGVTLGNLLAPLAAWQAGHMIGLSAYQDWQGSSAAGDTYAAPPDLRAYGVLLVPAFVAVITLTLMAGWSNDPDLDRPGAKPGYAANQPADPDPISSDLPAAPSPTAEPAPPGPGPATPPHG
ncbi:hypothetical protein [Mangrovihabitans endophyticus]|uniref:DUF2567 domain-containing protein n=1 Tax=Mangrovihabitans endophyticus TaxID=1751298 RepID=A0A8J3FK39_9ACTN|nr:hypothetical protein [Mangrovihabitans endophyticus]GGK70719.1 hypothetical protein GCM10012284_00710 [Mangrovihabitans endophyticus]